jgi:hypothetical protein
MTAPGTAEKWFADALNKGAVVRSGFAFQTRDAAIALVARARAAREGPAGSGGRMA